MEQSTEKVLDLTVTNPVIIDAEDLIIPTWELGGAIELGSPADEMYARAWHSIWVNTRPNSYWIGR